MEALRKAEAAKRAGRADAASDAAGSEEATAAAASSTSGTGVPDVFKFTTSDDLMALSPLSPTSGDWQDLRSKSESVPVSATTDDVLDDYLSSQQDMEADDEPVQAQAERERIKVTEQRARLAAASMFNAKAPPRPANPAQQKRMRILAGSLIIVCIGIAGVALYLATRPLSSSVVTNPALANFNSQQRGFLGEDTAPTAPAAGATDVATTAADPTGAAPAPAAVAETTSAPVVAANNQAPATAAATETAAAPLSDAELPVAATEPNQAAEAVETIDVVEAAELAVSDPQLAGPAEPDPADPLPLTAPDTADNADIATAAPAPAATLTISRTAAVSRIQPALQAAYNKLMQGDLTGANELYQEVLAQSANNRDALLGFAAVQLQLGNSSGARTSYSKLLQLNPQDALARTGLLQTLATADPAGYEQELQALHDRFPTLAPLNFALGNLHAGNGRWHEAQTAYFDALLQARREDNATPDYAFNLAVSLERIGQGGAALQYYREAETLAANIKPGFDTQLLRQRLTELESRP